MSRPASSSGPAVPERIAGRVAAQAYVEGLSATEELAVEAFADAESYRFALSVATAQLHDKDIAIRSLQAQNAALRDEIRRYTAARVREAA